MQTLRAYLKSRPLPAGCRLDAGYIFQLLCTPTANNDDLFEHHYDAACAEIASAQSNFTDVSVLLLKRGPHLSTSSFRHFCETVPKLSKEVFFHPAQRDLVCARGIFNVFDNASLVSGVQNAGPYGLSLNALGGAYKTVGADVRKGISNGVFVTIAGRIYSTDVAPLAIPGALAAWSTGIQALTPQTNSSTG